MNGVFCNCSINERFQVAELHTISTDNFNSEEEYQKAMDFMFGENGSGDEHEETSNSERGKNHYHRHSPQQINHLEAFFKECPHPDEKQRRQLSLDLGLEPKQIKFWFQNKRTQMKAQSERADNNVLKAENEKIHYENLAMKDALNNLICPTCHGEEFGEEDRQRNLQKLRAENALLKREYERLSDILVPFLGKSSIFLSPRLGPMTSLLLEETFSGSGMGVPSFHQEPAARPSMNLMSPYQLTGVQEMEKSFMIETAAKAMEELLELLRVNEPIWVKSSTDGRYFIDGNIYNKQYPKEICFKTSGAWVESSKDSGIVPTTAAHLIEIFSDSVTLIALFCLPRDIYEDQCLIYCFLDTYICIIYLLMHNIFALQKKWMGIFPAIVTKVKTIGTIETGSLGGSLHLMFARLHVLSPLVEPREFIFLRYIRQLDSSTWVIVDTSYDCFNRLQGASLGSWRLPSGCIIQEMPNGKAQVTWVEHVQVDGKSFSDPLFKELIWSCQAFGAKRWITTLERMCERFAFSVVSRTIAINGLGVIDAHEGRKGLMDLSHRMFTTFSEVLSIQRKQDFGYLANLRTGDIQVLVRENICSGQPHGIIVCVATSLWLPVFCESLFDFFKDKRTRAQWDVLSDGSVLNEMAHVSTGAHPGNCLSILKPLHPEDSSMMMLQESCIDQLAGLVIYAPIDASGIKGAIMGEDTSMVPLLPSGFVISGDGRSVRGDGASTSSDISRPMGSILTVVFQILMSDDTSKEPNMDAIETMHTLMSTSIARIKVAVGCPNVV